MRIAAHCQIATEQVYLLPMIVHEWSGGKCAWLEAQQARATAGLASLIEVAGQYFLADRRWVSRGNLPACGQIEPPEFQMRFIHGHGGVASLAVSDPMRYSCVILRPRMGSSSSIAKRSPPRAAPRVASVPPNMTVPSGKTFGPTYRVTSECGAS